MISSRKAANVDEALATFSSHDKILGMPCHVGKSEDREKLVQEPLNKFGKIDILVSNAGTNPTFGPMMDCPEDAWDKIFDVNVKAAFFLYLHNNFQISLLSHLSFLGVSQTMTVQTTLHVIIGSVLTLVQNLMYVHQMQIVE